MSRNSEPVEINGAQLRPNFDTALALQAGLLLICFLLIFGPTIPPLYHDWVTFETFSHGLLVPFISAYMIWQKRSQLLATPVSPSCRGVLLIIPAVLLGVIGKAVGDGFTERVALVFCLSGIVWLVFGWEVFKRLSFPLAYLFLMIPFPYVVVKEVAYQLRIIDAALAAPVLRLLGVPVYREAYYLHLPGITLEVADLCSGISSVFALLALGAAYVYFSPLRPAWKAFVVMSTFPFATAINLLRIVLTAALAYYITPAVLGVLVHKSTGTITFFIALFLFISLNEFLQRRYLRKVAASGAKGAGALGSRAESSRAIVEQRSWLPTACGIAVLIPAVYFSFNLKAQADVRLPVALASVPLRLGSFQALEDKTTGTYRDPDAENELSRKYAAPSGQPVEVYAGFRGSQHGEKRLRSPKLQFPFGWNFLWIEPAQIGSGNGEAINANWMLTQNNQTRVLVLYWYQAGNKTIAGETENRLQQIRGALFDRRSAGAIVRLATPVAELEKIEEAKSRLGALAVDLYPELRRILPQ